jgi:rubrerythrin
MKNLSRVLIVTFCFSFTLVFCTYAEEMKTAATPGAPSAPQKAIEKTRLDELQTVFNYERNVNARYLGYAQKADAEGYGKAASIFRAAARAEQVHFERLARTIEMLGGVPTAKIETPVVTKSTLENLKDALNSEIFESMILYPRYTVEEQNENIKAEAAAFANSRKADAGHARLFDFNFKKGVSAKDKQMDIYVCPVCGNVIFKNDLKICPICKGSQKNFIKVS